MAKCSIVGMAGSFFGQIRFRWVESILAAWISRCDPGETEHGVPLRRGDGLDREPAPLPKQLHPGQLGTARSCGRPRGGSIGRTARMET